MNATEIKIIRQYVENLAETGDEMRAAFITCTSIRDEATAKWGEETGIKAFHATADLIARVIRAAGAAA